VDYQDDQRHHQQNVDQTTRYVKAEAQKPQDKKDYENCPKHRRHIFLDCARLSGKPGPGANKGFTSND
jgi:hypothetical protein